jgi:hypothetical protein
MRIFRSLRYIFLLLFVMGLLHSGVLAQKNSLPPTLTKGSSVLEILEYLNKTLFPYARIDISTSVLGDETFETGIGYYTTTKRLILSQGFKLASGPDDCHLILRNDDVTVYDAESKIKLIDLRPLSNTQPPFAAEFSTWLETVSHSKGKASSYHNKNPEKQRLLGPWRTEFQSRGFFVRSIFGVRIPALTRTDANQYHTSDKVMFIFDDKHLSERFDASLRQVIKLCQARSTKPRWNRK